MNSRDPSLEVAGRGGDEGAGVRPDFYTRATIIAHEVMWQAALAKVRRVGRRRGDAPYKSLAEQEFDALAATCLADWIFNFMRPEEAYS